jgi:hypothetical protein
MAAIQRNGSTVQHNSGESLSMKQSWKDKSWYCDGLTLAPQGDESLLEVVERFEAVKTRLDWLTGGSGAYSASEDEVPF